MVNTSQSVGRETRYYRKDEQNNIVNKGSSMDVETKKTSSPSATVKQTLIQSDGFEPGDFSSSTESSISSLASVRMKSTTGYSKQVMKPEASPIIPPRAPVLETLKRTKRDLVKKQGSINGEGLGKVFILMFETQLELIYNFA